MELQQWQIVRSTAGRDQGRFLAVVKVEGAKVWVADGSMRLLDSPKCKNVRHLAATRQFIGDKENLTDRLLRKLLAPLGQRDAGQNRD